MTARPGEAVGGQVGYREGSDVARGRPGHGGCSAGHHGPAGAADSGAACRPDSTPPRPEVEVPAGVVDSEPGRIARRLSQPPDQRRGTER
jgi:hypothetical protein